MNLITTSITSADEICMDELPSEFRKATINMALAALSCEKSINKLPQNISKSQISVLFVTHFGELVSTLSLLNTYHETKTTSPILFQNSLHNSTLGFTTICLGLTGPAFTLGLTKETSVTLRFMVESLLENTPAVLVCFVDYLPAELVPTYLEQFPFLGKTLNKSQSFLFLSAEATAASKLTSIPFENFF